MPVCFYDELVENLASQPLSLSRKREGEERRRERRAREIETTRKKRDRRERKEVGIVITILFS